MVKDKVNVKTFSVSYIELSSKKKDGKWKENWKITTTVRLYIYFNAPPDFLADFSTYFICFKCLWLNELETCKFSSSGFFVF